MPPAPLSVCVSPCVTGVCCVLMRTTRGLGVCGQVQPHCVVSHSLSLSRSRSLFPLALASRCVHVHLLRGGKVLECDRRELIGDVLWLRMRGGQVRDPRVYFIICRDVHRPVRRGQVLKCWCVESVSAALPPFSPARLSVC